MLDIIHYTLLLLIPFTLFLVYYDKRWGVISLSFYIVIHQNRSYVILPPFIKLLYLILNAVNSLKILKYMKILKYIPLFVSNSVSNYIQRHNRHLNMYTVNPQLQENREVDNRVLGSLPYRSLGCHKNLAERHYKSVWLRWHLLSVWVSTVFQYALYTG